MQNNLEKLIKLGFEHVGTWSIVGGKLSHNLIKGNNTTGVAYAFVVNEKIKYIGKIALSTKLKTRFGQYVNPKPSQSTNINNNTNIKNAINENYKVETYVLMGKLDYKNVRINLGAGIEESLINEINPEWNKKKRK